MEIPMKPSNGGKYVFSEKDKQTLAHVAINGTISFDDYLRTLTKILNS